MPRAAAFARPADTTSAHRPSPVQNAGPPPTDRTAGSEGIRRIRRQGRIKGEKYISDGVTGAGYYFSPLIRPLPFDSPSPLIRPRTFSGSNRHRDRAVRISKPSAYGGGA